MLAAHSNRGSFFKPVLSNPDSKAPKNSYNPHTIYIIKPHKTTHLMMMSNLRQQRDQHPNHTSDRISQHGLGPFPRQPSSSTLPKPV